MNDDIDFLSYDDHRVQDIRDDIKQDSASIKRELSNHPIAGAKFKSLDKETADAWVAWTWLVKQLKLRGLSSEEAVHARSVAMNAQFKLGTYGAIADCIAAYDASEDEYGSLE